MFTDGRPRGWCRKCGYVWLQGRDDKDFKPDTQLTRRWNEEREHQYRLQKAQAERALDILAKERRWITYHENLEKSQSARELWAESGIPVDWQDFWKVGYVPEKTFEHDGVFYTRPALCIPKFDFGWKPTNIDFRLIDPPENVGKYRPLADLPAAAFISTPNETELRDEVFVVEGSKKAMVLSIRTGKDVKQVFGVPGCMSWAGVDERLRDKCGRVWVLFDPDAPHAAYKFARSVGESARVVELPLKPDDAILQARMTKQEFGRFLRQAVRAV
jgi:hypothetical protein